MIWTTIGYAMVAGLIGIAYMDQVLEELTLVKAIILVAVILIIYVIVLVDVYKRQGGQRLKKSALAVAVGDKNIAEVTSLSIEKLQQFLEGLELTKTQELIGGQILKEIKARIGFLMDVGLDYLTLARATGSLSGGEAQRIRLATQIGSGLVGVAYICLLYTSRCV